MLSHSCVPFAGSHLQLHWLSIPRKVLVVGKPSPDVFLAQTNMVCWLLNRNMTVYVEPSVYGKLGMVSVPCGS